MADTDWKTSDAEIEAIVEGRHGDPFGVLGLHQAGSQWNIVRAYVPGAATLDVRDAAGKCLGDVPCRDEAGFFEGPLTISERQPLTYRASNPEGQWLVADAYLCGPVLGPMDDYYIGEGNHLRLFDKLGAHPMRHEGFEGVHFAVWNQTPRAFRWWAISTIGTAAAT